MPGYMADFQYHTSDGYSPSMAVRYVAADPLEAVLAFRRFWRNRSGCLPCTFSKLLCVKVWHVELNEIDQRGRLEPEVVAQVFEWKCDTAGMLLEQWARHRLGAKGG